MNDQKKNIGLLLALILLLQLILPVAALAEGIAVPPGVLKQPDYLMVHEPAFATSTNYQGLGGNSSVEVKNGNTVIPPVLNSATGNYEYNDVPDGASVTVVYTLHLKDGAEASSTDLYTYTDANFFYLAMPEGLTLSKIQNAAIGSSFTLTALDNGTPWTFGTGEIVGVADPAHEGQLKITLSNDGQNKYDKWVSLKVEGTFDSLASGAPAQTELELGTQTLVFNRDLPNLESVTFVKDFVSYDAATNTASWRITLTPPAGNSALTFNDASLVDTLSSNQTYIGGSFRVNGSDPAAGTFSAADGTLSYTFPTGASGTHVFTYQTNPTSFGGEQGTTAGSTAGDNSVRFYNTANLMQEGTPAPIKTDDAELVTNWIEKSDATYTYYDGQNGIFQWTVTVKVPGGGTVTGASITDILPSGLDLITADTNYPVRIKLNTAAAATVSQGTGDGTYSYNNGTFVYRFPSGGTVTNTAVLTYYTKVSSRDGSINSNGEVVFHNGASFDWEKNPNSTPPKDIGTGKVPVGGLVEKSTTGQENYVYSPAGTYIQWTVVVNKNRVTLNNASISDEIRAGQELVIDGLHPFVVAKTGSSAETVTIIDTAGTKLGGVGTDTNFSYTAAAAPALEKFGYNFGVIPDTDFYTVTYYTKLTENSIDQNLYVNGTVSYTNSVTLTANGTTYTDDAVKRFSSELINKVDATSYDYNTKTAKWKITINRNRLELNNALLTDTLPTVTVGGLPQPAMTLLVDAEHPFTITPQNGGRSIAAGEITAVNGANGFSVDFNEAIYDTYVVEFHTVLTDYSLRGNQSDAVFQNSATIDADEIISQTGITDTGRLTVKNPVLTKDYAVDQDLIHWKSYINLGKLVLNGAQVSDTLTQSAYVSGSAKLYRLPNAALGADGKLLPAGEGERVEVSLTSGEAATQNTGDVTCAGNVLTVKLPNGGNSVYVLEFDTALPDKDINNYTNTITLTGVTSTTASGQNATPITVSNYWSVGAGGSTSYTLVKTSEPNGGGVPVQGATYRLVNAAGVPIRKNGSVIDVTTNENGVAVFSQLPTRPFYALEVQEPDGYDINRSPVALAANDTTITHDDPLETGLATLYVEKASSVTGTLLSGGSFGLYTAAGQTPAETPWKTAASVNGTISFTEVPVGSYIIKEIAAPDGYHLTADAVRVTVSYQNGSVSTQYEWPQYARSYDDATLENDPILPTLGTTVTIDKVSAYGALPLSGGTFVLSGLAVEVPFEQTASAQNGKVSFTGVPVGEYTIREQSAPGGYYVTDKTIRVTVGYDAEQTGYIVTFADYAQGVTPALENQPVPTFALARIYKVDAATLKPLAGAEFTLYDASGKALRTVVTNASGYAWFFDVPNGSYTIRETKAPLGYTASSSALSFQAAASGYKEFTVTNAAQSSLVPATGGENGVWGFALMGCALALGALYAVRAKKRGQNA